MKRAEAPRLLEYDWGGSDIRWELEPLGSGTRLTLWHNIDRRFISWGAAGWHICFDVLDRFLAGEPIGRIVGPEAMKFDGWQRLTAEYARQFGVEDPGWAAQRPEVLKEETFMSRSKGIVIGYWIATALFCLQMGFTAYAQLILPQVAEAFTHLGFPDYFRVELSWAKLLGVLLLLAPVSARLKEWAYAGFAIDLVSALIAHVAVGDGPEHGALRRAPACSGDSRTSSGAGCSPRRHFPRMSPARHECTHRKAGGAADHLKRRGAWRHGRASVRDRRCATLSALREPAGQRGRLADPRRHLRLVEIVLVDVDPAGILAACRPGGTGRSDALEEGHLHVAGEDVERQEPALALDAVERRVPLHGLVHGGHVARDDRVEPAPTSRFQPGIAAM